jgi:hypothetical protein
MQPLFIPNRDDTMTDIPTTWQKLARLGGDIGRLANDDVGAGIAAAGLAGVPLGMLFHAVDLDPNELTAAALQRCTPYYAAHVFSARMERLAGHGLLQPQGAGYRLTERGRGVARQIDGAVQAVLATVQPLNGGSLNRLDELLRQLAAACLANPDVPEQWCVITANCAGANNEPSPLARIAQSIRTLEVYRCDCHLAAWRPLGTSGPAWEAFTLLWRGAADSPAAIQAWSEQQAVPRGYTAAEYAGFLAELTRRGWVAAGAAYRLTSAGRAAREGVEATTDTRFYAPWSRLRADELEDLDRLAGRLLTALEELHQPIMRAV